VLGRRPTRKYRRRSTDAFLSHGAEVSAGVGSKTDDPSPTSARRSPRGGNTHLAALGARAVEVARNSSAMTDPKNEPSSGSPNADRKPHAVQLPKPTQMSRITSLRVQIWALLTGFNRGVLAVGAFAAAILAIGGVVLALEHILHSGSSSTRLSTHASSPYIALKKSGTSATEKPLKSQRRLLEVKHVLRLAPNLRPQMSPCRCAPRQTHTFA
jgi:hypothetical protein